MQVTCLQPFLEAPRVQLRYSTATRQVVQDLALPLAPHKFMVPEPHIAKDAFFDRWKSYAGGQDTHACLGSHLLHAAVIANPGTSVCILHPLTSGCAIPKASGCVSGLNLFYGMSYVCLCACTGPPLKMQQMLERGTPLGIDPTLLLLRGLNFGVEHLYLDPSPNNEAGAGYFMCGLPGAEQALLVQVIGGPWPDIVSAARLRYWYTWMVHGLSPANAALPSHMQPVSLSCVVYLFADHIWLLVCPPPLCCSVVWRATHRTGCSSGSPWQHLMPCLQQA